MARRLAPLDGTRHLDGTAEQQQLFGQRGLARVGVGDDGEGAPPGDLFLQLRHGSPKDVKKTVNYNSDRTQRPAFSSAVSAPSRQGNGSDAKPSLLQTLPKVGPTTAQRIIEYRETQGPFETIEQIQEIKGIGPATFEGIKDLIVVGEIP